MLRNGSVLRRRKTTTEYGAVFSTCSEPAMPRPQPDFDNPKLKILGLTPAEKRMLSAAWNMPKSLRPLARHANIPEGSAARIAAGLENRNLLQQWDSFVPTTETNRLSSKKKKHWKANTKVLLKIINSF